MPTVTICGGCTAIVDRWRRKAATENLDPDWPPSAVLMAVCRDCSGEPLLSLCVDATLTGEEPDRG